MHITRGQIRRRRLIRFWEYILGGRTKKFWRYEPIHLSARSRAFLWLVFLGLLALAICTVPWRFVEIVSGIPFEYGEYHALWSPPGEYFRTISRPTVVGTPETVRVNVRMWLTNLAIKVPIATALLWLLLRQIAKDLRVQYDLCIRCGYELRNLRAGRCPECGARLSRRNRYVREVS